MDNERLFYENCTRDLITAITGFKDDEENYQICLDFALSHFVSRVHPDVNWFSVERKISGLCEKYLIDSELKKYRKLQELTNLFSEAISKESVPQKVVSYAVLSLLCSLCGAGGENGNENVKYSNFEEHLEAGDSEAIDWYNYLREDNIAVYNYSDDDDESVWSDSSSEINLNQLCSSETVSVDSGIGVTPDTGTAPPFPPLGPFKPYEESKPFKPVRTVNPYWNPRYQSYSTETCDSKIGLNFTSFWEEHLAEKFPIYTPQTNVVLSETNILREILWMLHGVKSTYMFLWVNDQFQVRKHVHLNHLTEGTLHKMLTSLCPYGTKVVHLQNFISQILEDTNYSAQKCHTYKAYAKGLQCCLHQYVNFLTSCEKIIIDQSETVTIIQLISKLEEHWNYLEILSAVHARVVKAAPVGSSSFMYATSLLNTLWKEVGDCSLYERKKSHLQSILRLFFTSFHPYICMLEAAAVQGELLDPYSEFLILSNPYMKITDNNFWQDGLLLQTMCGEFQNYFLNSVMKDILVASVSMQMLKTLDTFYDTDCRAKYPQNSLFSSFITKFETVYKCHLKQWSILDENKEANEPAEKCESSSNANNPCEVPEKFAFQYQALNKAKSACIDLGGHDKLCNRVLDLIQPESLVLLDDILGYTLLPCIKDICSSSKKALVQELKEKYHLMQHVSVMKKYFLMESGDRMFTFYTEIFEKVFCGEDWCNNTFINHIFKDAISTKSVEEEKLLLYISETVRALNVNQPLSKLSLLNLTYNVGWPISIILNQDVQKIYCEVFCFLLQVKCAKHCLDDLYCYSLNPTVKPVLKAANWWTRKEEMKQRQVIHAMHILRMKILHFINGFHTYIMTSILHCAALELDTKLESAESLGDIMKSLHDYAQGLLEQCFLNAKHPHLQEQIHNILNLALRYQTLWRAGIEKISVDDLRDIEHEFISRLTLVTTYLKKPWKRGEHLHLEILANSISTNCYLQRLFL